MDLIRGIAMIGAGALGVDATALLCIGATCSARASLVSAGLAGFARIPARPSSRRASLGCFDFAFAVRADALLLPVVLLVLESIRRGLPSVSAVAVAGRRAGLSSSMGSVGSSSVTLGTLSFLAGISLAGASCSDG